MQVTLSFCRQIFSGLAVISLALSSPLAISQQSDYQLADYPFEDTALKIEETELAEEAQQKSLLPRHQFTHTTLAPSSVLPVPQPSNVDSPPNHGPESSNLSLRSTASMPSVDPAKDAKKKQEDLKKKVATAHKGVFYANDFNYVLDPSYAGHQFGDSLKRRRLFKSGYYDIGGEYRLRQHHEHGMRGLGLTGKNDDFLLRRARLYGNFEFTKNLRVFGEMIDARGDFENLAPRGIEVNEYDMLNLFVDAKLWSEADRSVSVRAGRQELLLGDQRLISPLDWANTRRTFDGYRATAKSKELVVDGFYTSPVIVSKSSFDSPDLQQEFMGLYSSYTGFKDEVLDFYVLRYNNATGVQNYEFNSFGTRLNGSEGDQLYDFEVMYQTGRNTDGSAHDASSYTAGLGRKLNSQSTADPRLWFYFDWASGGDSLGAGNGFHHLFPLAHRYNGFMDLFGRRNLGDFNSFLTFKPTSKFTMLTWYHYFFLANKGDSPYNVTMLPFNPGNAPGSRDLGHELDLLGTYAISPRQSLMMGYSHFWSGKYYDTTVGVPSRRDADFLYTQWSLAF